MVEAARTLVVYERADQPRRLARLPMSLWRHLVRVGVRVGIRVGVGFGFGVRARARARVGVRVRAAVRAGLITQG